MTGKELLGALSVALSICGYGNYIVSILRNRTKPHSFSWGVWALLMFIVFFAQMSRGGGAGAWVTGFSACACVAIALLAVRKGEKSIAASDRIALGGALLTIPLWLLTDDPLWAVVTATLIDAFAYYPTFRKSWLRPDEENPFGFSMDVLKWIAALFALENYSAITLLYPLFLLAANSSLVGMILIRRARLGSAG